MPLPNASARRDRAQLPVADVDGEEPPAPQDDEMVAVDLHDAAFVDAGVLHVRDGLVGASGRRSSSAAFASALGAAAGACMRHPERRPSAAARRCRASSSRRLRSSDHFWNSAEISASLANACSVLRGAVDARACSLHGGGEGEAQRQRARSDRDIFCMAGLTMVSVRDRAINGGGQRGGVNEECEDVVKVTKSEGAGNPGGHRRLDVRAVAQDVLSAGRAAGARARIREPAGDGDRDQRHVLPDAEAGELREVARRRRPTISSSR